MNKLVFALILLAATPNCLCAQKTIKKFMKEHQMDLCPTTQKLDSSSLIININLLNQYITENKNFDPYAYYMIGMEYYKLVGVKDTSKTIKYFRLYVDHPRSKGKNVDGWWNLAFFYAYSNTNDCQKAIECLERWSILSRKKDESQMIEAEHIRKLCAN